MTPKASASSATILFLAEGHNVIRRLKKWKRELAAQWKKLSSLMRFCAGLAVAVAMAYYVVNFKVKPLQAECSKLDKELLSGKVPAYVPQPEEDNELQETKLKLEAISTSLDRERRLTSEVIRMAQTPSKTEEGRIVGVFDTLVFERGLDLLQRERVKSQAVAGRIGVSEYIYRLAGSFEQVRLFLKATQAFPYPSEIVNVSIHSADTLKDGKARLPDPPPRSADRRTMALEVQFLMRLYFVEEGKL
jgi:hypothetical protein